MHHVTERVWCPPKQGLESKKDEGRRTERRGDSEKEKNEGGVLKRRVYSLGGAPRRGVKIAATEGRVRSPRKKAPWRSYKHESYPGERCRTKQKKNVGEHDIELANG